jgi:hypothetical protein
VNSCFHDAEFTPRRPGASAKQLEQLARRDFSRWRGEREAHIRMDL